MGMMARDQPRHERLELPVLGGSAHYQRRAELLEHVAVGAQQQHEELVHVMGDQVDLQALADMRALDGFGSDIQAQHLPRWEHVRAAQVHVRIE